MDVVNLTSKELQIAKELLYSDLMSTCRARNLHPLAVVNSGQGLQVYFLRSVDSSQPELEKLNRGLANALGGDLKATDAARILRLPGSTHWKNYNRPLPVEVWYLNPSRLATAEDALWACIPEVEETPPLSQPEPQSRVPRHGSVIERFNARFPIQEVLEYQGYRRDGDRYTRPGEDASGRDVVLLPKKSGVLCSYHHSSNDPINELEG